jgi:hypothetical protein
MERSEMKIYQGQRPLDEQIGDCKVFVIEGEEIHPLHCVGFHADEFEWGYGGSGPADTALSILADYFSERPDLNELRTGNSQSWQYHQQFKRDFIAGADQAGFTITSEQITQWLQETENT